MPQQQAKQKQRPQNSQPKKQKVQRNPKPQAPRAPVAVGVAVKVPKPVIVYDSRGKCCVRHTELIGDIIGSTAFAVNKYAINPGLASMFPWLNSIATNYESYKFKRLRFRYSQACATSQVGYVYLAVEYDSSDPVPDSEAQLATYEGCIYGSPWVEHRHDSAKHNLNKRTSYFTRPGALPAGNDIDLYDTGYLVVATTGNGGTPVLGKLWVEYDVEFSTPQLGSVGIGKALSSSFTGTNAFTSAPAIVTGIAPLVATGAAQALTLTATQPYQGLVALTLIGTALASLNATGTATASSGILVVNSTNTNANFSVEVNWKAPGETLILTLTAAPTVSNYACRIGQYDVNNA